MLHIWIHMNIYTDNSYKLEIELQVHQVINICPVNVGAFSANKHLYDIHLAVQAALVRHTRNARLLSRNLQSSQIDFWFGG